VGSVDYEGSSPQFDSVFFCHIVFVISSTSKICETSPLSITFRSRVDVSGSVGLIRSECWASSEFLADLPDLVN